MPDDHGTLETTADGGSRLRFTRLLPHPPERVWRAITEPEHLASWFPTTIEGDRRPRAPLRFSFPAGEAPPMAGEMLRFEPPSLMELRWGPDVIRLELRAVQGGTELTLLDRLDEHGKAARDGAGWHTCLDALAADLAGDRTAREALGRWEEAHAHYVEAFGPEAATVGPPDAVR